MSESEEQEYTDRSNNCLSLDDIEIPNDIDFSFLLDVSETNLDEISEILIKKRDVNSFINVINLLSQQLPMKRGLYVELLVTTYRKMFVDFREFCFNMLLTIQLINRNCLPRDFEFKGSAQNAIIYNFLRSSSFCSKDVPNVFLDGVYSSTDFTVEANREIVEFGFPKNTFAYFIKYDMINEVIQYYVKYSSGIDSNTCVYCTEAAYYFGNQKINLISLASFYGAVKSFKLFSEKGYNMSLTSAICSVIGGSIEIIHLHSDIIAKNVDKVLYYAMKVHNDKIVEWILQAFDSHGINVLDAINCLNIRCILCCMQKKENVNFRNSKIDYFYMERLPCTFVHA